MVGEPRGDVGEPRLFRALVDVAQELGFDVDREHATLRHRSRQVRHHVTGTGAEIDDRFVRGDGERMNELARALPRVAFGIVEDLGPVRRILEPVVRGRRLVVIAMVVIAMVVVVVVVIAVVVIAVVLVLTRCGRTFGSARGGGGERRRCGAARGVLAVARVQRVDARRKLRTGRPARTAKSRNNDQLSGFQHVSSPCWRVLARHAAGA